MKFVIKCLTGQIDVLDVAVSNSRIDDITAEIFEKSGTAAQTCLFFEDTRLADGSNLSEHIVELCKGTDINSKECSAVSDGEGTAARSADMAVSATGGVGLSSKQDGLSWVDPDHPADAAGIRCSMTGQSEGPLWMVTGGAPEGGVFVREGQSLKSPLMEERLLTGAHIQQIELRGQRLRFRRLTGTGPQTGWISTEMPGKILAERADKWPSQLHQTHEELLPVALLFPGEGVQYMGMVRSAQHMPVVKDMFDKARVILGHDLLDLILAGPEFRLTKTTFAQPAIFIASLAALEKLKSQRPEVVARASAMAGFGLGHYTALCAAGVMSFEDGLRIVKARAEAMEETLRHKKQHLITVVGLNELSLRQLCIQAAGEEGPDAFCQIAHYNFPLGYCVGGTERAALLLKDMARDAGALVARAVICTVASETRLMRPALDKLSASLEEAMPRMKPLRCNIWTTTTAQPLRPACSTEDIVSDLEEHLTHPVLWELSMRKMLSAGINEFYEVGPRHWLRDMSMRIDKRLQTRHHNIEA